jgi:hypothetical protein
MMDLNSGAARPDVAVLQITKGTQRWVTVIDGVIGPALRRLHSQGFTGSWMISVPRDQHNMLYITLADVDPEQPTLIPTDAPLAALAAAVEVMRSRAVLFNLIDMPAASINLSTVQLPWPSGSPQLAHIRNQLYAALLPATVLLLRKFRGRSNAMFAHVGLSFMLIHNMQWGDTGPLWPLSLYGQVRYARQHSPALTDILARQRETFLPAFTTLLIDAGFLDHHYVPDCRVAQVISAFQSCYDAVKEEVGRWPVALITERAGDVSAMLAELMPELNLNDLNQLDASAAHLSFRIFMTMLYDALPIFDIGTSRRILLFDTILRAAEKIDPDIFDRTAEAGFALVSPTAAAH